MRVLLRVYFPFSLSLSKRGQTVKSITQEEGGTMEGVLSAFYLRFLSIDCRSSTTIFNSQKGASYGSSVCCD